MKRFHKNKTENFLDKVPCRASISWHTDEKGHVVLEIENRGIFHRITQVLFHKPKISYVHLDSMGSFLWPLIDGSKTVYELAQPFKEAFGEEAEPLYPRISKFFQILSSYDFVSFS